tara:strand:- start:693 stop:1436 length:744 start_codon:yes stop_codon:yes gene_type:complete
MLKKGAMFGLFRAFKKESGRLFLASRQSVGSQETRDSFKTNRGAMFGLDARIALAIFGALSVISGAALYSAIQNSQATALYTEMKEVFKAWEQYYIDTGSQLKRRDLSMADYNSYIYETKWLVVEPTGINNWQGPYLDYTELSTGMAKIFKNTVDLQRSSAHIVIQNSDDIGASDTAWVDSGLCVSGKKCYYTVQLTYLKSDTVAKNIDKLFDNANGPLTGSFKWYKHATQGWHYLLQVSPAPNPND